MAYRASQHCVLFVVMAAAAACGANRSDLVRAGSRIASKQGAAGSELRNYAACSVYTVTLKCPRMKPVTQRLQSKRKPK